MFKFVKLDPIFRRKDVDKLHRSSHSSGLVVSSGVLTAQVERQNQGLLLPVARSGHRAFFHAGVFYIIGGYQRTETTLTDVWQYHPLMHHWERVQMPAAVPPENLSCASVVLPDKVFQFGGSGADFGGSNSDKLLLWDLQSLVFSEVECEGDKRSSPRGGYGGSLTYSELSQCLYLCCGTNGALYHTNVHKFTLSDNTWSILPADKNSPSPRYRQECFVWRESWFIIGGSFIRTCQDMSSMHRLSFATEKWEQVKIGHCPLQGYPVPRRGFGSVVYRDRLYIFGGSHFLHSGFYGDLVEDTGLWYIDLVSMRWNLIGHCTLPKPVDFFAIAVDGYGKVLLNGGRDDLENNRRTPQTFVVWVDVPPLIELCWEKIKVWENESFLKLPLPQLMSNGIPRKLADQIQQFHQSCVDSPSTEETGSTSVASYLRSFMPNFSFF